MQKGEKSAAHPYLKRFTLVFLVTLLVGLFLMFLAMLAAILGFFGGIRDLDIEALASNNSSQLFYVDSNGNEQMITTLSAEQNRIWVDADRIPQDMKDAFVAIEDERFYSHNGFDAMRTTKAFFAYVGNKLTGKRTTFGGSTITQQLVKNLTRDTEQTAARKVQEISRAVNLEKQISKDKILELYMNSIYLSQGCNGVQTASQKFFGKDVSELNLAQCASIAGITQYPSLYDPLVNPDKNKEKQEVVLNKMLELEYITKEEYDDAIGFELVFEGGEIEENEFGHVNSYFVDHVINDVEESLLEMGYSKTMASKMIYSGGLKIVTTMDPKVQDAMELVFENTANFYDSEGEGHAQAAMVVMDPYTGEVKGIVGGIGTKKGNRVLNRATETMRQPGSAIKPIAVYAPALENKVIHAGKTYKDAYFKDSWPRNASGAPSGGMVTVSTAVRRSHNTVPVHILDELGPNTSYNFMTEKLGFTTLVRQEERNGKVYSDIGLAQLALGGLTDGVTVMEMTAAYAPFINKGIYSKPYCIKSVTDFNGNTIIANSTQANIAMSEENAYIMSRLLGNVVSGGTGGGAQVSNGVFTGGKTGTTSDNHDRWFVGITPNYVGAVWYGYDTPKGVSAPGNPCIAPWKAVMDQINQGKKASLEVPNGVRAITYCTVTGKTASEECEGKETAWFASGNTPGGICNHPVEPPEDELTETGTEGQEAPTEGEAGDAATAPTSDVTTLSE